MDRSGIQRRIVTIGSSDRNVLQNPDLGLLGGERVLPREPYQEPVARVSVLGHHLLLPEPALREGLSDLRLATEARVSLENYATGVALVLTALARRGLITVSFGRQAQYRGNSAIP
jgi:hypothetical protein